MCSIWQSFLVLFFFFSWIIIHEDIPGMSLLLWKMQSKVSSAYSIVGINALHVKKCWRWSLLWVYQKIWESCRKSHLHPWNYASSLPAPQRSSNVSFPSQSLCLQGWKKNLPWCTPCTAEGVFKLLNGPHRQRVHKVIQDAAQAPPAGAHRTPLSGLCSAPRVMLCFLHPHSYKFLGICIDYTGT